MTSPANKPETILGTPIQPTATPNLLSEQRDALGEYHLVNEWNTEDGTSVAEVATTPPKAFLDAHDLEIRLGDPNYVYEKPNGDTVEIFEHAVVDSGVVFHTPPDRMLSFAEDRVANGTWTVERTPTA